MSKDDVTEETIREMARLTMFSNRINPLQERNLKMYPFVFFSGVKTARIDYDFSIQNLVNIEEDSKNVQLKYQLKPNVSNFKVIYSLDIDEGRDNDNIDKRFEALRSSITTLFWSGISVEVLFNGKKVYASEKNG